MDELLNIPALRADPWHQERQSPTNERILAICAGQVAPSTSAQLHARSTYSQSSWPHARKGLPIDQQIL